MDKERLDELYRIHGPAIYARCRKLLSEDAAAEDATQETFLKVHRHLAKLPVGPDALLWIYRIATNTCLNHLRQRQGRQLPLPAELAGTERNLEDLLADRQLAARLVNEAPEKLRLPAWLHYVDGLEQGEVARVLGVTRRTVVNWLAAFGRNARAQFEKQS